ERRRRAEDAVAEEAGGLGLGDRVLEDPLRVRVLVAQVDEAARRAGRAGGDRHALEARVRVVVEQDPVLEAAGLALVPVADARLRLAGRLGHRASLAPGGDAGAAAPGETRGGELAGHLLGRQRAQRALEAGVAAGRAVAGEGAALRVAEVPEHALLA